MKTFVIASLALVALTAYALTNIWFYKLGQTSVNAPRSTTITKKLQEAWSKASSPDVLGESQSVVSSGTDQQPITPPKFSSISNTNPPAKPIITACDPSGKCNSYNDPKAAGCPITFSNSTCDNLCGDPSKRCRDY